MSAKAISPFEISEQSLCATFMDLHPLNHIYGAQVKKPWSKPVVPNLLVTADRSTLDNFTAAREYSMLVVIFQQLKRSYLFEPSDRVAACPTLSLYAWTLSPCARNCASIGRIDQPHQSCKRASIWSQNPEQHLFLKPDLGPKAKCTQWVKICATAGSQKT